MNSESLRAMPSSTSVEQKALVTDLIFDYQKYLTDWERKFCNSISDYLDKGWVLSPKQVNKLRAIQSEVADKAADASADSTDADRMQSDPNYFHNE